jgi:hypothetical protein
LAIALILGCPAKILAGDWFAIIRPFYQGMAKLIVSDYRYFFKGRRDAINCWPDSYDKKQARRVLFKLR